MNFREIEKSMQNKKIEINIDKNLKKTEKRIKKIKQKLKKKNKKIKKKLCKIHNLILN